MPLITRRFGSGWHEDDGPTRTIIDEERNGQWNERERGDRRFEEPTVFMKRSCTCCSHATMSVVLHPSFSLVLPFIFLRSWAQCTCYRWPLSSVLLLPVHEKNPWTSRGSRLIYDVVSFRTINGWNDTRHRNAFMSYTRLNFHFFR